MEEHALRLQFKMHDIILSRCDVDLSECFRYFTSATVRAWERQCYDLTILSGEMTLFILDKLKISVSRLRLSMFISLSYYQIGNYSGAQIWLKRALKNVNEDLKNKYSYKLRGGRLTACFYLLMSGDYFSAFCYGYIIRDFVSQLFAQIIEDVYEVCRINTQQLPKKQPASETVILSMETSVTEEKYTFVWSQFVHKFQCAIDKHIFRAQRIMSQLDKKIYVKSIALFLICF